MPKKKPPNRKHLPKDLEILYEDKDILVINKPAGLLTVATATNKFKTAYYILTDYVRKGSLKSRKCVFTVHRLDQWTSGVLIFCKSEDAKDRLQDNWKQVQKTYVAVVYGKLKPKQGIITSYLFETKNYVVRSTTDKTKGKRAQTGYKVLKEVGQFSLVELDLLTGRKNQIRVHLADKGNPIRGDRKYGKDKDTYKRLALHAKSISFTHPTTNQRMTFEAKLPSHFKIDSPP
ncbi:MAG: RluA family pseudouridine synthase [Planctomycetes bacterium]|nr:RluA family pseudouridine synthase [Planctomycetota bacterium]